MLDHQLDRRSFNLAWVYALLGTATITVLGCDDDNTSPVARTPDTTADTVGVISNNHGHTAVITGAQMMAGGALRLSIRGNADHDHMISLTAADVASVRGGSRVSVTSTNAEGHMHTVAFN
jgi:hypothetical protein